MSNWLPITFKQHQDLYRLTEELWDEILKHVEGEDAEDIDPEWERVNGIAAALSAIAEDIESQDVVVPERPEQTHE